MLRLVVISCQFHVSLASDLFPPDSLNKTFSISLSPLVSHVQLIWCTIWSPYNICWAEQIMKLLFVLFYPSCFNFVPFSARYLSLQLNLEHPWPVTKFGTNMTTDKIVILCVAFCIWSVRLYSCQYNTKFVYLLCQYVTVSLSVEVCSFSQLYIYICCCDCCCRCWSR